MFINTARGPLVDEAALIQVRITVFYILFNKSDSDNNPTTITTMPIPDYLVPLLSPGIARGYYFSSGVGCKGYSVYIYIYPSLNLSDPRCFYLSFYRSLRMNLTRRDPF